jgi:hypothetical protein
MTGRAGQTDRIRQAKQDRETGQAKKNRQSRIGRAGYAEQARRTGQAEQDNKSRTANIGQPERDRQNKTTMTWQRRQPGQDRQEIGKAEQDR